MGMDAKTAILEQKTALGIEFGSTRIKAVLVDESHAPIAMGTYDWENRLENNIWTYSLEDIWTGIQDCYQDMAKDVKAKADTAKTKANAAQPKAGATKAKADTAKTKANAANAKADTAKTRPQATKGKPASAKTNAQTGNGNAKTKAEPDSSASAAGKNKK